MNEPKWKTILEFPEEEARAYFSKEKPKWTYLTGFVTIFLDEGEEVVAQADAIKAIRFIPLESYQKPVS